MTGVVYTFLSGSELNTFESWFNSSHGFYQKYYNAPTA